ncbi:hypothetical protein [Pendulispora albinea]|uniref:ABC-2 type transport system permease protein n=1 Tax=Pendulispora albinea TaxID=2741071 RepID=A0ABZ2LX28_9BACT
MRFGAALALGGLVPRLAAGLAGLVILSAIVFAALMGRLESRPPLELLPSLTASALAWGSGLLLAFASATQVLRRDREQGIWQLLRARGGTVKPYLWARLSGLAVALFAIVGGGALLTGLVAMLVARRPGLALSCAQSSLASLVYAAAFAVTLAPLAVAALGARTRAGGYFGLLLVIFLPELLLPWTEALLPGSWGELASLPSALAALRGALMPEHVDVERFVRAAVVLGLVAVAAFAYVKQQVANLQQERVPYLWSPRVERVRRR